MMSENVMVPPPLFHQRSHSMPVGQHGFINGYNSGGPNGVENRTYDFKRSSPLKNDTTPTNTEVAFPLPIPTKSLASQLNNSAATNTNNENNIRNEEEPNFFCTPKSILNLFDYNRKIANCPIIFNCKMVRGFFTSQAHWTCYRRNYFQVTASFMIPGHSEGTCYALQLHSDKSMQPIQQFFLRLKACTSSTSTSTTSSGVEDAGSTTILENHNMIRSVALTQMTPKRDKGPQREPPMIAINPSSDNNLYNGANNSNEQVCVTFERLQFRVATANNGKRRASQQYFRLIFELVAQLADDQQSQHVVAECYSSPLVVRGRSPGHYSSEAAASSQQPRIQTIPANYIDSNDATATKRKRKLTPSPSSSPIDNNNVVSAKREKVVKNEEESANNNSITLPPPQYVYGTPPMVIEQPQQRDVAPGPPTNSSTTSTSSSYSMIPVMTPTSYGPPSSTGSAFSNFHNRSQSANDSEFYARQRQQQQQQPMKYNSNGYNNQHWDDSYEVGMARALRNWQQQVIHQRTDSAATYDSFDRSTRPGTPIPYSHHNDHYQQQQQGWQQQQQHHHSSAASSPHHNHQPQHYMDSNGNGEEKLNHPHHGAHHDTKLYNN